MHWLKSFTCSRSDLGWNSSSSLSFEMAWMARKGALNLQCYLLRVREGRIQNLPCGVLGLQHEGDVVDCTEQGHHHNLLPLLPIEHVIHLKTELLNTEITEDKRLTDQGTVQLQLQLEIYYPILEETGRVDLEKVCM